MDFAQRLMDFVQTMKDWRRMCKAQEAIEKTDPCRVCPLANNGNDCCGIYEDNDGNDTRDYARIEGVVARWAKENPEPVYPTWGEWFVEHGDLVDGWQNATNAAWMANTALSIFMKSIPADIAEKLGIEPKEGV